jgi:hypothetical protein
MPTTHRWRSITLRLWRVALLVAVVFAIRRSHQPGPVELSVERVRDYFPSAAVLAPQGGMLAVQDESGISEADAQAD